MAPTDDGRGGNCSACDQPGPCEDQGLCLDPTVIRLNPHENAGARSDAVPDDDDLYDLSEPGPAAQAVGDDDDLYDLSEPADGSSVVASSPTPTDAYLIEGQLVVRSEDGTWRPISMPAHRSDSANSFHELTAEELEAMQIPSDPEEARAYLLRQRVDTIPHGNHVDFVVGDRLIHVVTGGEEDCGYDCADECKRTCNDTDHHHGCAPGVVDHGAVNVARKRAGGADGAKYMPLVRKTHPDDGDYSTSGSKIDMTSPEAIVLAVDSEHLGGTEPSTHTRLKVQGICCPSEVPLIHSILDKKPGIRGVKVIVPTKTVLVEHAAKAAPADSIVDALNAARLQASLASAGGDSSNANGADASDLGPVLRARVHAPDADPGGVRVPGRVPAALHRG